MGWKDSEGRSRCTVGELMKAVRGSESGANVTEHGGPECPGDRGQRWRECPQVEVIRLQTQEVLEAEKGAPSER